MPEERMFSVSYRLVEAPTPLQLRIELGGDRVGVELGRVRLPV